MDHARTKLVTLLALFVASSVLALQQEVQLYARACAVGDLYYLTIRPENATAGGQVNITLSVGGSNVEANATIPYYLVIEAPNGSKSELEVMVKTNAMGFGDGTVQYAVTVQGNYTVRAERRTPGEATQIATKGFSAS